MSIIKLRGRRGKYYKKGFNAQQKNIYFYNKQCQELNKTLNCVEIDCKNIPPCKNFSNCLKYNKLKYKNNKKCYNAENN